MSETMIVGSPQHRKHMQKEAEAHIDNAMEAVADEGVFSPDQSECLKRALWSVYHAICATT